jgi:hypothetical protein
MINYPAAAAALFIVYLLFLLVSFLQHANKARQLGCGKPAKLPQSLGGLDLVFRLSKAAREQTLPEEFVRIYEEMGRPNTWVQSVLGAKTILTVDPQNIQAVLAKQFHDFGVGPVRRGNFRAMLGDGIFTDDGKAWYVSL